MTGMPRLRSPRPGRRRPRPRRAPASLKSRSYPLLLLLLSRYPSAHVPRTPLGPRSHCSPAPSGRWVEITTDLQLRGLLYSWRPRFGAIALLRTSCSPPLFVKFWSTPFCRHHFDPIRPTRRPSSASFVPVSSTAPPMMQRLRWRKSASPTSAHGFQLSRVPS